MPSRFQPKACFNWLTVAKGYLAEACVKMILSHVICSVFGFYAEPSWKLHPLLISLQLSSTPSGCLATGYLSVAVPAAMHKLSEAEQTRKSPSQKCALPLGTFICIILSMLKYIAQIHVCILAFTQSMTLYEWTFCLLSKKFFKLYIKSVLCTYHHN